MVTGIYKGMSLSDFQISWITKIEKFRKIENIDYFSLTLSINGDIFQPEEGEYFLGTVTAINLAGGDNKKSTIYRTANILNIDFSANIPADEPLPIDMAIDNNGSLTQLQFIGYTQIQGIILKTIQNGN